MQSGSWPTTKSNFVWHFFWISKKHDKQIAYSILLSACFLLFWIFREKKVFKSVLVFEEKKILNNILKSKRGRGELLFRVSLQFFSGFFAPNFARVRSESFNPAASSPLSGVNRGHHERYYYPLCLIRDIDKGALTQRFIIKMFSQRRRVVLSRFEKFLRRIKKDKPNGLPVATVPAANSLFPSFSQSFLACRLGGLFELNSTIHYPIVSELPPFFFPSLAPNFGSIVLVFSARNRANRS